MQSVRSDLFIAAPGSHDSVIARPGVCVNLLKYMCGQRSRDDFITKYTPA